MRPGEVSQEQTSVVFDHMADEYDDLRDLWYSWLFSRLHLFIARHVLSGWRDDHYRTVLDIGCGTGFQSFLYALTGAEVLGIDIAEELLAVARAKAGRFQKRFPCPLFPAHFNHVIEADLDIAEILAPRFMSTPLTSPRFEFGDAASLPCKSETYDHVNCCGSVLSYVSNYSAALAEIARVLKPGGSFVLEVETKYNFDLLWTILDAVVARGAFQFDVGVRDAFRPAFSRLKAHETVRYPFGAPQKPVYMNLRLFVGRTLKRELSALGLKVSKCCTIHSITNFLPSTLLDNPNPSAFLASTFKLLSRIERGIAVPLPGCSLVLFGRKEI